MEYLAEEEFRKLSAVGHAEYEKNKSSLRRDMRALLANLDSKTPGVSGSLRSLGGIANFFDENYELMNAQMMQSFVGRKLYDDFVVPHMNRVKIYNENIIYAKEHKMPTKLENPRGVRDYFDIPTLYHFYKYQKTIKAVLSDLQKKTKSANLMDYLKRIRNNKGNEDRSILVRELQIGQKTKYYDLSKTENFFDYCFDVYANQNKFENMAFQNGDIRFLEDPIKSYETLSGRQKKAIAGGTKNGKVLGIGETSFGKETDKALVIWEIQENVYEYMSTRALRTGRITQAELDQMKQHHIYSSVERINRVGLVTPKAIPAVINELYGEEGLRVLEEINSKKVIEEGTEEKEKTDKNKKGISDAPIYDASGNKLRSREDGQLGIAGLMETIEENDGYIKTGK